MPILIGFGKHSDPSFYNLIINLINVCFVPPGLGVRISPLPRVRGVCRGFPPGTLVYEKYNRFICGYDFSGIPASHSSSIGEFSI